MRLTDNFGLYLRSVCLKYKGCVGCPLTGGVVTYFGDSGIVCESGKDKVRNEQRTGNNGDNANQAADAENQK